MERNNIKKSTLEQLEGDIWTENLNISSLVKTTFELRKKRIQFFTNEDFRIMINQNIGLKYLMPLAIDILNENAFAEGDYYEGDLLKSVLRSDVNYWASELELKNKVIEIFKSNKGKLNELDLTDDIKEQLIEAYEEFSR